MKKIAAIIISFAMIFTLGQSIPANAEGSDYYELQEEIVLPDGGYSIDTDYIGLKTVYVNIALRESSAARYTGETVAAVKAFQEKVGLPVTGVVDKDTWCAIGDNVEVNYYSWPEIPFNEETWYSIGTYVTPLKTTRYSKRADIVNAIVTTAAEYEGTPYRVGCSGFPGTAADCSGLVFQCLYAAGINPEKNIVDHALAIYEYTSRNLCADPKLGDYITTDEIQAGDLIYYHSNGIVCHVGVCVSSSKMYDAWPNIGTTYRNWSAGGRVFKVQRVLPNYDDTVGEIPENAVTAKNSKTGLDSMVVYDIPGMDISGKVSGISVIVSSTGIIDNITLSTELSVPEDGGFVLNATGTHGDWILNNLSRGDRLWIDEDLVYTADGDFNVVTGSNRERKNGDLILYTEGETTGTDKNGAEICVDGEGVVVAVEEGVGNAKIPAGGCVLSGNGLSAEWLMINVSEGQIVTLEEGVISVSDPEPENEISTPVQKPAETTSSEESKSGNGPVLYGLKVFMDNNFFLDLK